MILTASTLAQAKELGLTVSPLCGSNDLQTNICPDPAFVDVLPLTDDGKAFLALLDEERRTDAEMCTPMEKRACAAPKTSLTEAQRSALLVIAQDDDDAIPGRMWIALESLKEMGLADEAGNITNAGRAVLREEVLS